MSSNRRFERDALKFKKFFPLLFLLCVMLFSGQTAAQMADSQQNPISRFVVSNTKLPEKELNPESVSTATIDGAEVNRYSLDLRKGQFATIKLNQVSGDLVLIVFDPDNKLIEIIDRNKEHETEVANLVAEKNGKYSLQVAVFDWKIPFTDYSIELPRLEQVATTPAGKAEQLFRSWYDDSHPGAAVVVLHGDKILFKQTRGLASVEYGQPIKSSTAFELASVSKQFTGFAIAMLIDRGVLSIDDDIRKYLPEVPDFGKKISIGHLLNHTSGLRDWDAVFALRGVEFKDGLNNAQILQMVSRQKELNFSPGDQQQYSNTGYNLLAEIIARSTGQSLAKWTQENLFKPLGMHESGFNQDYYAVIKNKAMSYEGRVPAMTLVSGNSAAVTGSSSVFSSIDDLVKWVRNFDSGQVGGESLKKLLRTKGKLNNGETLDYAFGNTYSLRKNIPVVSHLGLVAGYRTSISRFPEQEISVIYLSNDGDDASYSRASQIEDLFIPAEKLAAEVPPDEPPSEVKPVIPFHPEDYAGLYYSDELMLAYEIKTEKGNLVASHPITGHIHLRQVETDRFESDRWYMPQIVIVRDAGKKVTGLRISTAGARNMLFQKIR
jgi:CubicO group peptidase (beta-lactamase class C family)